AEPFEHARTGEVIIDLVLEDDRDECEAEHRVRADGPHAGQALKVDRERIGDLVFDLLRTPSRPVGEDDDLVFAEVRDGVHRRAEDGADGPADDQHRRAGDEVPVPQRPFHDAINHEESSKSQAPGVLSPKQLYIRGNGFWAEARLERRAYPAVDL